MASRIVSFKENKNLYECVMDYGHGAQGTAYLTKAGFLEINFKEKLRAKAPELIKEFKELKSALVTEIYDEKI